MLCLIVKVIRVLIKDSMDQFQIGYKYLGLSSIVNLVSSVI
jgi:hypothetical protein